MRKLPISVLRCVALLGLLSACDSSDKTDLDVDPSRVACELDWKVASVVPCVAAPMLDGTPPLIYSSHIGAKGIPECDPYIGFPQPVPADPWSEQSLIAEAAGDVRLCIAMKHGQADAPSASDCALFEYCFDATYDAVGEKQALPALPGWAASDEACSRSYYADGGYIELRASSDVLGCGTDAEQVERIQMCPLDCDLETGDTREKCKNCRPQTSVSGAF